MDFDCYTGDCSSIPTHDDSLGKWMNLCPSQPMICEGNWEVYPRCWRAINLHNVYNWENGLLRLNQIEKFDRYTFVLYFLAHRTWKTMKYYCFMSVLLHLTFCVLILPYPVNTGRLWDVFGTSITYKRRLKDVFKTSCDHLVKKKKKKKRIRKAEKDLLKTL